MTIDPSDMIAIAALLTTWLGSLAGVWFVLWRQIDANRHEHAKEIDEIKRDLAAFQTQVARDLGARTTVEAFEDRMVRLEQAIREEIRDLRQAIIDSLQGRPVRQRGN